MLTVTALLRRTSLKDAAGLLAIAIQHEIDHLDGLLFIDRISPIKREFFKKRYKKIAKAEK
jgi:peptide deformylase